MVNVFIIHSGKDYDYVKNTVEPYLRGSTDTSGKTTAEAGNANILTLKSGTKSSWKADARKKIRMAQVVIIVIGEDANDPGKEETMGWEVKTAVRFNKQIMLVNRGEYPLPSYLYHPDRFTKQEQLIAEQQPLSAIRTRIDNFARGYYNIFSPAFSRMDESERAAHKNEILDQYKMFQKTSEDLVSRRQAVNSFYISVNSALVALLGVITGLVGSPTRLYVMFFMCVVGIILDISWTNILESYGTLNAAKMKVINLLESQLPIALYDAEWRVMSDKLNNKKYVSFTSSEKRIPKIFGFVYATVILVMCIYALYTYL